MASIKELKIQELFSGTDYYIIPIYQRNFAWKESHIVQLIDDINDYAIQENYKNYYIGTLVVFERENNNEIQFETIDGQQRLTTLFILLSFLKKKKKIKDNLNLNLKFESRETSSKTLEVLYNGNSSGYNTDLNVSILQAYDDIEKRLNKMNEEELDVFQNYLLEKVRLLRVSVPKDTDLNHYFEIMNNRGEQLEKQEILKAKLLNVIKNNDDDTYIFNLIWEACSNMEKYVQYGFKTNQRNKLFGENWNEYKATDFDNILQFIGKKDDNGKNETSISISNLIKPAPLYKYEENIDETPERFTSPINFSNFLLQVLRIQADGNIPLDDKRLLETFEDYYKNEDKNKNESFVKEFSFNLLKFKFLSDKYIIKREFLNGNDGWSLKQLQKSENNKSGYYKKTFDDNKNRQILMLLAMFHVSAPTLIYKHWFNAALKFVNKQSQPIKAENYISFLEELAKAFLYDRFLAKTPVDYFTIIYKNECEKQNSKKEIDEELLNQGTMVENFIFNYLDYLLWKDKKYEAFVTGNNGSYKYADFEFSFRSSVEHFYPQHPIENIEKLDNNSLNNFGNLCLISRSKNSRLSNLPPEAKKSYYIDNRIKDSIKQGVMMSYKKWGADEIMDHYQKMEKILLD